MCSVFHDFLKLDVLIAPFWNYSIINKTLDSAVVERLRKDKLTLIPPKGLHNYLRLLFTDFFPEATDVQLACSLGICTDRA